MWLPRFERYCVQLWCFFYVHMKLYIYTILKKIYHESMYLSVIQLQGDCTNFLALALLVCYAEVLNIDIQVSIRELMQYN